MNPEIAQKLWEIYCDELIDNADKTSEDVRQALATLIRKIVSDYEDWKDGTYMVNSIHLLDFAYSLENLK
jgi:hypothetical protein